MWTKALRDVKTKRMTTRRETTTEAQTALFVELSSPSRTCEDCGQFRFGAVVLSNDEANTFVGRLEIMQRYGRELSGAQTLFKCIGLTIVGSILRLIERKKMTVLNFDNHWAKYTEKKPECLSDPKHAYTDNTQAMWECIREAIFENK